MARRLVDSNTRREVRRQGALLDRLTAQFRGRLQREIATAMREMVEHWEQTGNVTLPRDFRDRIEATYRQMAIASITMFGSRIMEQAKARGLKLETKESFAQIMTRRALRFIEQEAIRRRITEVTETTRDQIIRAVRKGYEDGLGQRGTASYILDLVPQISSYRAEMIARTETHGAANYGSQEAAKQTGLPLAREWLAAADDRTRETHRIAATQPPVGMDEKFKVGDAELMFPGDPEGPGDEVINCRCAVGYIVDEAALEAMFDGQEAQPQPAPEPQQQFAYENALMPQTAEEAATFIVKSGIALNSRLDGMKIPAMQGALRGALEVTERYGLSPITGIGPSTRFGLKRITNANAAIARADIYANGRYNRVNVLHLPTQFGDIAEYQKQNISAIKSASKYKLQATAEIEKLENTKRIDSRVIDRFSKLQEGEYSWTYSALQPAQEMAKIVVYHEYGHVLHLIDRVASKEINDFLSRERPLSSGWQYLVSKYAGQDNMEYIAETFSIYMHAPKSQWYRIHPELLSIYQKLDKKK